MKAKDRQKILYGVPGSFELSYLGKNNDGKIHRSRYEGLIPNLERRYTEADSSHDAYFKRIANFATEQVCRSCQGYRLQKPYLNIRISDKNIGEIVSMSVEQSLGFFGSLSLTKSEVHIAKPILKNIVERLEFLSGVGLEYMTLARRAGTLSGGESQRIRLATQIGTRLE